MGYGSCLAAWYAVVSVGGYDGILPLFIRHHANRKQDWAGFDYLATSHVFTFFRGKVVKPNGKPDIAHPWPRSCEHRDPANPVGLPAWYDVFFSSFNIM